MTLRRAAALRIAVPVWGAEYVRTFLTYSLPTQLSPRNIPGLAPGRHTYTLFTTREDFQRIEQDPLFRRLGDTVSVDVIYIDEDLKQDSPRDGGHKYEVKSNCYRRAFAKAADTGAAVVPSNADIAFADGFFHTLETLVAEGKRAVQIPGPRGLREPIGQTLIANHRASTGEVVIGPVELAALWLKHIHPLLDMHFVEGPEGGKFNPSHLYWRVGDEGIIARCFNLHPYIVHPRSATTQFTTTVDDDLIEKMALRKGERFIARDSRQIFCCELSPPEQYVGDLAKRGDLQRYVEVYAGSFEHNIRNLEQELLIVGVNELGSEWRQRRRASRAFTKHLLKLYRLERRRREGPGFLERSAIQLRTTGASTAAAIRSGYSSLGRRTRKLIPAPVKPVLRKIRAAVRGKRT